MIRMHAFGKEEQVTVKMMQWVEQALSPSLRRFCPGGAWTPAINLYEDDAYYYMVADLAGMEVQEVELRVKEGTLILDGQRALPKPPKTNGSVSLLLMEIDHGRFCRTVDLPKNADVSNISAYYRSGYLWVRIPRRG